MFMHFLVMCLAVMCMIGFTGQVAHAANLNDVAGSNSDSGSDSHNTAMSDYLQNQEPVTAENMAAAQKFASPLTDIFGNLTGFACIIVSSGIFVITALDLVYIGLPPFRSMLYSGGQSSGGMGMGMGGGQQGGQKQRQWVSDECLAVCGQSGGGQASSGMGMGMGMGMNSMGGQGGQQQGAKSMILEYFKKRTIFLIIFAVATVMLTSSIFTDCGINLANLLFKVMDTVNGNIQSAM